MKQIKIHWQTSDHLVNQRAFLHISQRNSHTVENLDICMCDALVSEYLDML